jgi:hypothetical protein
MEVSIFWGTRAHAILILGIGQETTVLTTLPFLVVSLDLFLCRIMFAEWSIAPRDHLCAHGYAWIAPSGDAMLTG